MLVALNKISASQSKPTENTMSAVRHLLDYAHTYPNATIRYYASAMILYIVSDAAYLVLPNARSRVAGHFFLSNQPPAPPALPNPKPNGPIHTVCKTLRNVVSSAAESETGGIFVNGQEGVPIIVALEEMGHKQPPNGTPLETDSESSVGINTRLMRPKRSKSWDMRYH